VVDFDGRMGEAFDEISWVEVGPDDRIAYIARSGNKYFVMHDGKKSESWDEVSMTVIFDPGGNLCYGARLDGHIYFVRGGNRHGPYDSVSILKQGALVEHQGKTFCFGDRAGEPFDEIPDWSFDTGMVEYAAREGKDWFVVKEGRRTTDFRTVEIPVQESRFDQVNGSWVRFVPGPGAIAVEEWVLHGILGDGRAVIEGTIEGKQQVAIGPEWGGPFDEIPQVVTSPRGRDAAYVGVRKIPAQESETYYVCTTTCTIGPLEWNPMATLAFKPDGSLFFVGKREGMCFMEGCTEGVPDERSGMYARVCQREKKVLTVVLATFALVFDERGFTKRKGEFADIRILPRSRALFAVECAGEQRYVWVQNRRVGPFDWVDLSSLAESEDGTKVAFGARIADEFWWKVCEVTP